MKIENCNQAICTMSSFYYYDHSPYSFSFHFRIWKSQRDLNKQSPNLHKEAKPWRILVVNSSSKGVIVKVADCNCNISCILIVVIKEQQENQKQRRKSTNYCKSRNRILSNSNVEFRIHSIWLILPF